ncbi:MAG: LiaF domain-containing protein [Bacilli bacterium]
MGFSFYPFRLIIGLNALEITDINIFFNGWWTLFIIVPCFIGLFKNESKTANIIGLAIGIFLLLGCQNIIKFELIWKLIVPIVLVMIGISFIFKDTFNKKVKQEIKKLNKNEKEEHCSTFGVQEIDFTDEKFKGCNLSAVFGGVECNLKNAIIKEDSLINTSAIFGGITIYVPKDVNIKITSTPIFGGVSDDRKTKTRNAKHTIYIKATSIFGGVEIK